MWHLLTIKVFPGMEAAFFSEMLSIYKTVKLHGEQVFVWLIKKENANEVSN